MRRHVILIALMLVMRPLGAQAADLVVWWDKGYYAEEDEAVREIIAAFEHGTGMDVDLVLHPLEELAERVAVALEAGQPPDFAFGYNLDFYVPQWALEGRLVDLSDAIGHFSDLFDPAQLDRAMLLNARTGQKALYGLPVGQLTLFVHIWTGLLEQAGFTLDDVPEQWGAFWSFWCDQVQPSVRQVTGRQDVWGVGLSMADKENDTLNAVHQFIIARGADYVTRDGRLVIDEPEIRQRLVEALDDYTAIYRRGCTPPDSPGWGNADNNERFHTQAVVLTPNLSLSIPNALKSERPDDYYENTATIEWPLGPSGEVFPIVGFIALGAAFAEGANVAATEQFVRFLVAEGWLAHYLNFSGERLLPSMPKLLEAPFWLDPSDRHRMAAVMQAVSRPLTHDHATASGNLGHHQIYNEVVWGKAVYRIVTEGISPEQAVDEAIARI